MARMLRAEQIAEGRLQLKAYMHRGQEHRESTMTIEVMDASTVLVMTSDTHAESTSMTLKSPAAVAVAIAAWAETLDVDGLDHSIER